MLACRKSQRVPDSNNAVACPLLTRQLRRTQGRLTPRAWTNLNYDVTMIRTNTATVRLRRTVLADVPILHAFECEITSNQLAGTKPRAWGAFSARWNDILSDPSGVATGVTPRVVLLGETLVGSINISPYQGAPALGYWIAGEFWGRGIASQAVSLMLREFTPRPLYATAASHNLPSHRVLHKNGFVVIDRRMTPETERLAARETMTFVLR